MNKVSAPVPGDLVFYGASGHDTHHVGIYIGNGKMIDALKTGTHVEEDNVSIMSDFLGYWQI
jgi:cell wall-associated NlpC family hydrolase